MGDNVAGMTDPATPEPTPPIRYAVAGGGLLVIPAGDEVDNAMSGVVAAHRSAFDAALQPFGLTLDSLLQATWMRWVRVDEIEPFALLSQANADLAAARAGVDLT